MSASDLLHRKSTEYDLRSRHLLERAEATREPDDVASHYAAIALVLKEVALALEAEDEQEAA